jgi:hypothetical protein
MQRKRRKSQKRGPWAAIDFPVRDRIGEERNRARLGSMASENIVSQRHAVGGMMVNQMASSLDGAV